jgi:hypothetical protein
MARAQLQVTNLGSASGGRKILASVHTPASMPPHRVLFCANYGKYCIYIGVNHKTILLNEESARYMNFIGWMARAFEEKEEEEEKEDNICIYRNCLCIYFALLARR